MSGSVRLAWTATLRRQALVAGAYQQPAFTRSVCSLQSISRQQSDTTTSTSNNIKIDLPGPGTLANVAQSTATKEKVKSQPATTTKGPDNDAESKSDNISAVCKADEVKAAESKAEEAKTAESKADEVKTAESPVKPQPQPQPQAKSKAKTKRRKKASIPKAKAEEAAEKVQSEVDAKHVADPDIHSGLGVSKAKSASEGTAARDAEDEAQSDASASNKGVAPSSKTAAKRASKTRDDAKEHTIENTASKAPELAVGGAKPGEDSTRREGSTSNHANHDPTDLATSEKVESTANRTDASADRAGRNVDVEAYRRLNEARATKRAEAKIKAKMQLLERQERKQELRLRREAKRRAMFAKQTAEPGRVSEGDAAHIDARTYKAPSSRSSDRRSTQHEGGEETNGENVKIRWITKEGRALINANTVKAGRFEQLHNGPKSRFEDPTVPLGSGSGAYPPYLPFEHTKMIYPPSDVYPPPIPRLRDADLDTAARALAVLRTSGVQWIENRERRESVANGDVVLRGVGQWRSVVRDADWLVDHSEMDRLDSEQSLEYIGDSLLHLLSRSALMMHFPRRTMVLYNLGANFLVSNDVFGHVYRDSGLDEERRVVAKLVQERNKAVELKRVEQLISRHEYEERVNMPLPEINFQPIHHLRQADLFEAYVGGVYLTLGFNEASKWCTRLFQPWLDRLGRTPGFDAPRFLTPDGELHARIQLSIRNQVEQDLRDRSDKELSKVGGVRKWLIRLLQRASGTNVYLDARSKEEIG